MDDLSSMDAANRSQVFHECRGIMGTEHFGQDDSLRRAIQHYVARHGLVPGSEAAEAPAGRPEAG